MAKRQAERIISDTIRSISDPALRSSVKKGLSRFYAKQCRTLSERIDGKTLRTFTLLMFLNGKSPTGEPIRTSERKCDSSRAELNSLGHSEQRLMGVPLQRYTAEYTQKHLKPALDEIARLYATDPDDPEERNSLRGMAEAAAREADNREQIETLRGRGVKLVVVSAHADCSERCRPYQGNVYSLDGSSGMTDDGRRYEPIERATDVYLISKKSGKVWKNGLLGFNCRHRLIPYESGLRIPVPSESRRKSECAVTERQRELERNVRKWSVQAETLKGVNEQAAADARRASRIWRKRYYEFCEKNKRAVDLERLKIL